MPSVIYIKTSSINSNSNSFIKIHSRISTPRDPALGNEAHGRPSHTWQLQPLKEVWQPAKAADLRTTRHTQRSTGCGIFSKSLLVKRWMTSSQEYSSQLSQGMWLKRLYCSFKLTNWWWYVLHYSLKKWLIALVTVMLTAK